MHYTQNDFHIHNNLLSDIYKHYPNVNISPSQENNVFGRKRFHNLKQYLDKLLNAAESVKKGETVEKEK